MNRKHGWRERATAHVNGWSRACYLERTFKGCFLPLDTGGIPQVHCAEVSSKNTVCVCVWPTHAYTHSAWCKVVMHPDRSVTSCLECCSVDDGYHHCALCSALQPHRQAWFLTVTLCTENSLFTPANTYRSLIFTINGCINGMLEA